MLRYACDACLAQLLDRLNHGVCLVELLHLVAATDALADYHDVGYGSSTGRVRKDFLQLQANGMFVELDDVGRRLDVVLLEENVLGFSRVRAVCFGENNDWGVLLVASDAIGTEERTWTLFQDGVKFDLCLVVVFGFVLLGWGLVLRSAADRSDALERLLLSIFVVSAAGCLVRVAARDRVDVLLALLFGSLSRVVCCGLQARAYAVCVTLLGRFHVLFCLERFLCLDVERRGPCLGTRPRHVESDDDCECEQEDIESHSSLRRHDVLCGGVGAQGRTSSDCIADATI